MMYEIVSTLSRVSPGIGSIIEDMLPAANLLNKELLPTLGLPINETVKISDLKLEKKYLLVKR